MRAQRTYERRGIRRLANKVRFILLHSSPDGATHRVEFRRTQDDALEAIRSCTRVSPIVPFEGTPDTPKLTEPGPHSLTFLGPLHPGEVDPELFAGVYATLGYFNLLIVGSDEDQAMNAICTAEAFGCTWEQWSLSDVGRIEGVLASEGKGRYESPRHLYKVIRSTAKNPSTHLAGTEARYRNEVGRAVAKATRLGDSFAPELRRYDDLLRDELKSDGGRDVVRLKNLSLAANAVSRHAAQTYSGTSPILVSPCDLAEHSFLGVGLASLAVARVRRFVERVLTAVRYFDRVEALRLVPPIGDHLEGIVDTNEPVLSVDHLTHYGTPPLDLEDSSRAKGRRNTQAQWSPDFRFGTDTRPSLAVPPDELPPPPPTLIPLINFISQRDGYRASKVSLSVPPDILSSCNASSWSLMTLTHELSHAIIDELQAIVAPLDDPKEIERICAITLDPAASTSLLDDLTAFFYVAVARLRFPINEEHTQELSADNFVDQIEPVWREVLEVLTHSFDYIHFYLKNPDKYVRGIWASWAVLPTISAQSRKYVIRSLCALHVGNYRRDNGEEATYKQLVRGLKGLPDIELVRNVLKDLAKPDYKAEVLAELRARALLVQLVATFWSSKELSRHLEFEFSDSTSNTNGLESISEAHQELAFTSGYVANPVRFLESLKHAVSPDASRAIWTLSMLAFEPQRSGG